MVFHSEIKGDLRHGVRREVSGEVDDDTAGVDYVFVPFFGFDVGGFDIEFSGNDLDDVVNRDVFLLLFELIFDSALGEFQSDGLVEHGAHRVEFDDGSFDLPDVVAHVGSDIVDDLFFQMDAVEFAFFLDDGDFCLQFGGLDIGEDSPFKPGAEPIFQAGDLFGGSVGAQHNLFSGVMKFVERVEEFVLGLLFAAEELDVVDEKQIALAVILSEELHGLGLEMGDEFVHEVFESCVDDPVSKRESVVADCLEQMGFSQSDASVDKKRIVLFPRLFGDAFGGGVGELVGAADDETVEGEGGVEQGFFVSLAVFGLRGVSS